MKVGDTVKLPETHPLCNKEDPQSGTVIDVQHANKADGTPSTKVTSVLVELADGTKTWVDA